MATKSTTQVIIPTSVNLLTAVVERLVASQRRGTTAVVTLPSLRQRARMVTTEAGVLPIVDVADPAGA